MSILLNNHGYDNAPWHQALTTLLPEQTVHVFDQVDDIDAIADDIEYAVIWNHPQGDLQRYPKLKGILLLGAGTEHIDADPHLPSLPVVRLVDPDVLHDMSLYALYWVMDQHRLFGRYREQQQQQHWQRYNICPPADYCVTVLGLGAVGKAVAKQLQLNGFFVNGWDRLPQQLDAIHCYHGATQFGDALQKTDVLINCLPLTAETHHFIDAEKLNQLPRGANLINISRGSVIDDNALLNALNTGHISHAVLDAFAEEPLPTSSPYWQHTHVTVTPHMSGATYARSAAALVAANIERIERGETPFPLHYPPSHATPAQ